MTNIVNIFERCVNLDFEKRPYFNLIVNELKIAWNIVSHVEKFQEKKIYLPKNLFAYQLNRDSLKKSELIEKNHISEVWKGKYVSDVDQMSDEDFVIKKFSDPDSKIFEHEVEYCM